MSEKLPSVTILVPAKPDQADVKAVTAGKLLDYPREKLEILLARGKQPSIQRNTGLRAARGEIIYFLDDDSVPPPDNLKKIVAAFADPSVKMVGGPNLCPADAPVLEQVFALVHASWLAFGPSYARYARIGKTRTSGEKELILCNLAARKQDMLDLGGFNELLYPNEENALMDELAKRGKLIYDPDIIVHRRPRRSLRAFIRMLLNYGRGRAEQFRVFPTLGSAPNFVPPLFVLYLLLLPLLWYFAGPLASVPLIGYGLALLLQAAVLAGQGGGANAILAIPLMFVTHVFYGIGFFRGLFTSLKPASEKPKTQVVLESVPL